MRHYAGLLRGTLTALHMLVAGAAIAGPYEDARRLADQGNADAEFMLGSMYRYGWGVSQDYAEAVKWFRKAADQGNADAEAMLGMIYRYGVGVSQDDAEAAKWFRKAADQGYHFVQVYLGIARRLADQGNADAELMLGKMYRYGVWGVSQDYAEAVKWFRKTADQGNADAETLLGHMYRNGEGVPQNYAEAAKWYRKAADQGHNLAQVCLGSMYENGQGLPQDYVQAHMRFNLARAAENRDLVAAKMTPEQIAEALKLAREWTPIK